MLIHPTMKFSPSKIKIIIKKCNYFSTFADSVNPKNHTPGPQLEILLNLPGKQSIGRCNCTLYGYLDPPKKTKFEQKEQNIRDIATS